MKWKSKRAVSQIIGTLFMLAIVVPIGSVIVTKGLNQVGEINNRLASGITLENEKGQEDIVFEHIRFDPMGKQITISVRNVGTTESTISKVTVVKTQTQELIVNDQNISINAQPKVGLTISEIGNISTPTWDDSLYRDSEYKIAITTEKGNFFEISARPFNT
jgi:predicted PurR-regulated permease PerM